MTARVHDRLRSIDVATLPYPGIATDYKPLIVTMLSVADGVGIVTEMAIRPGGEDGLLRVERAPADLFPVNTTRVAYRRGRTLRRYEQAFVGWLAR